MAEARSRETAYAPRRRVYAFTEVLCCAMCDEPVASARVLGLRLDQSQGLTPRRKRGIAVTVVRCAQCGLVFCDPQPVPNDIADHYGIPPESYWQADRLVAPADYFATEVAKVRQLLPARAPIRALDIGAGLGFAMEAMTKAGFDVYGIEPSEPFLRRARERPKLAPERLQLATIEEARFDADSFDFVTFGAVLEHLYNPGAALEKAMSWLRPGGIVQAEIPNADHLIAKVLNIAYKIGGTGFVTNLSPMHSPYHLYEFTAESFRRHGARAGYTLADHRIEVATIRFIPFLLHPLLRWQMARTGAGLQLHVWLKKTGAGNQ